MKYDIIIIYTAKEKINKIMKDFKTFEDVFNWVKTYKTFGVKSLFRLGNFLMYEPPLGLELRKELKDNPANKEKVDKVVEIINKMYNALNDTPYGELKWFNKKVKVDLYYLVKVVQGIIQG